MPHTALVISLIVVAAMLCQWLAWRVRLPAILFLLLVGLVVGPVLHWLEPDALFGDLLMPMVSLSVAVILFEGSLTLKLQELRDTGSVVRRMISVGALATWVIVAVATRFIFDFSWEVSTLFGAIVIVTGPTVIVPMLRSVRPNRKLANILRWEGIAIDPIGALMAVMTYEFILASSSAGAGNAALGEVLWLFFETILVGCVAGLVAGVALSQLLSRHLIPEYLQNLATLSLVLVAFSGSNALVHESGLLTVTVMGMWMANRKDVDIHPILNFKEHLTVLLISVLFIVLAARIDLQQLATIGAPALVLLAVLQFVARPVKVWISTVGLDVSWPERGLLAWIAPRGIVAAAISAIFADKLVAAGYPEADLLVPLTFSVIIGTVVLQSATARPLARWLGVAEPSPRGFLIVGANIVSRALAEALGKHDIRCVLADSNRDDIRQARLAGLETFYGNPVSEHAENRLDLSGIGGLLTLSRHRELNLVTAMHYRADFGAKRIFSLAPANDKQPGDKHQVANNYRGTRLFGENVTYAMLASRLSQGEQIKSTTLSDAYDWPQYQAENASTCLPLIMIDPKGQIKPFTPAEPLEVSPGSTILALAPLERSQPVVSDGPALQG